MGTVFAFDAVKMRLGVLLKNGERVNLKPENLRLHVNEAGFASGFLKNVKPLVEPDMPFIKANKEANSNRMPEVQAAMEASSGFLEQRKDQWMNEGLLKKIAARPSLAKRLQDPYFIEGMIPSSSLNKAVVFSIQTDKISIYSFHIYLSASLSVLGSPYLHLLSRAPNCKHMQLYLLNVSPSSTS